MNTNPLRSGRARRLALAAALVAIAATVVVTIGRPFSADTGPLVIRGGLPVDEAAVVHTFKVDVGDQFLWGFNIVKNTGDDPVHLRSVRMLPESSSSPVVDARARQTAPMGAIALGLWPLSRNEGLENWQDVTFAPLAGYTIPGGQEAEIVVIMEKREPGRVDWNRIRLTYEAGGKTYLVEAANHLSVCTPRGADCPPRRPPS